MTDNEDNKFGGKDMRNPNVTMMILVANEVGRAKTQHGLMTDDLVRAHLILAEEVGEFSKAVADFTRVHIGHKGKDRYKNLAANYVAVQRELIQVVSTAQQILENLIAGKVQLPSDITREEVVEWHKLQNKSRL